MNTPSFPSRYKALNLIGSGGEGRVYRVQDTLRGSQLALKVVPRQLSKWLHREFETLRQIRHENLIQVFDWGVMETTDPFYTMELVLGAHWSDGAAPQPLNEVARVLACVLRGLAHLHSHGEIHGDLKPGNVLIGREGSIKVTDVGMGAPGQGTLSGTPGYTAPEIWGGSQPSVRSDIYSVGVMAYEALTGHHPFKGKTIREVVSGQLEGWVASPAVYGVRLPVEVERGIMRALERDSSLRPGSADEFMETLGVANRTVGILGGRFVARASELVTADTLLDTEDPSSPTLLWVTGEEGIGKTAFIDELANHAVVKKLRVTRISGMPELGDFRSAIAPTFAESEQLWAATHQRSVFIFDAFDEAAPSLVEGLRTLGRHLHAIATERGEAPRILLLCEVCSRSGNREQFEQATQLLPFTPQESAGFINGYLGQVRVQPEVVDWLHMETGGVPGRLAGVIHELISRELLRRTQGLWTFQETHAFPSIGRSLHKGRWHQQWNQLSLGERALAALVSALPKGLDRALLAKLGNGEEENADGLIAKGWLKSVAGRLQSGSGEIRRVALEGNTAGLTRDLEVGLISTGASQLLREERAWLLVRNLASKEALEEGMWATITAKECGDLRKAIELGQACADLAGRLGDTKVADRATLIVTEALHLLGQNEEAMAELEKRPNGNPSSEHLLGLICRSRGNLDEAKAHFANAIALAQEQSDSTTFLQSHAELAEIEWRHGDQSARESAIARLNEALVQSADARANANDKAALIYQLGAALVTTGKRIEGIEVLEGALKLAPSDYWMMRIANALAAAEYYLGRFEKALGWMDEAWTRAERGGFDSFKARIFSGRAGVHYGLGKFRESIEYHRASSLWALRTGQQFEYLAACSGESADQMFLAEYERALTCAREAYKVACEIGNEYEAVKNLETEALCLYLIGDWVGAKAVSERVLEGSRKFGQSSIAPRALLLGGILAVGDAEFERALELLERAESMLLESGDWEDLPLVQIELQLIRSKEDAEGSLRAVLAVVNESIRTGALTVQLRGCVVLGEILLANRINEANYRSVMIDGLGRAGNAGALEDEWRLNYALGELALRGNDRKSAMIRLAQALRVFRAIADRLTPEHRKHYLKTPHASRLLSRFTESKD